MAQSKTLPLNRGSHYNGVRVLNHLTTLNAQEVDQKENFEIEELNIKYGHRKNAEKT